jgi:hypothetical protein
VAAARCGEPVATDYAVMTERKCAAGRVSYLCRGHRKKASNPISIN